MADATLTLPGGNARPALPAALTAAPTILALDLGTTTGWALRTPDGLITSGTVSFRPSRYDGGGMRYLRFTNWLTELDQLSGPIAAIWYEEVRRHVGTDAAHVYGGLMATLTAWAELRGVPYQGVPVGTIKRHATGKGNADKAGDDRRRPRPRLHPDRRQRGRRPRHPALGDRDPRRRAMSARQILEHTADVVDQRRQAYGAARRDHGGDRRALVAHPRPAGHAGAGDALHDRPEARPARPRPELPRRRGRRHRLRRPAAGGAGMKAMRWHPARLRRRASRPDQVKREGWREQGVLAVAIDDERLTWPERELVRQLGEKLYGKRAEAGHG